MKKIGLISSAFLLTLALAACGGGKSTENTDSRSSAAESTTVESTKASATKESSSKATTKSSDAKPSGTTTASSTKEAANNGSAEKQSPAKNANPDDQANQVLNQLANMFPGQGLPQAILTSQTNNFLTAATTSQADQNNFRVLYYAEKEAIPVNDARVNQLTPISSFEKKTYGSDAEAKNAVNQIIDNGGQPVDLGYNITGYKQGAAGSSYLSWQEGNWSLVVRASNINGESPDDLAKNVVNILEQETLPAPNTVGQITLNVAGTTDYNRNSVVWQAGTVVYSVHHFDPIQAVKMATSM
ncbi:hypothetical protein SOU56_001784 [Enterococcus faecalis]|uniref:Lipoprotein n=1 Tax=Enterococcus faecalis TaxID=1351 RepID=A0A8B3RVX0_ENTFL|nr:hypothetical protein [Enterococcus faecalis]EGO2697391.1 hypothetical protein [Enterococcus faecalis]EGO2802250.1 hypothetical protein [Enterococcus faecalis]EGO2812799.1 hypothetical protein [Enterococcus faecalis]EGO2830535.1 hypothetical protein [Enterococcus faecalis]EGO5041726.1 hypothetical protein [Enterococcus faecalis]